MERISSPPRLAPRSPDAHKASVGRVLVVGGSRNMTGAPALAALGALRAGAGLVRVAVPASVQSVVAGHVPEATSAGLPETSEGAICTEALAALEGMDDAWDAVVVGPGTGRAEPSLACIRGFVVSTSLPLVLDADGLFALGAEPEHLSVRTEATVITPHEGEAARLLGGSSADVRADREAAARTLAERTGGVVVLKGKGTLVTDGTRLFENATGGPALASGGTGDVLAGVVGAFLAGLPGTGGDAFGAACAAVHVHGSAADGLTADRDRGVLASDVAGALPAAIASLVSTRGGGR
ncbi:MAG: NAD(P)H-hydrate dehydratase [Planctomycetota bacterium]|jgi:NAD(P)H-hydrate epimerase